MTSKTHATHTEFDKRYSALNTFQREAVDTIEGPVLCIAGPGTGKTEVIALRVGNILNRTQMRPSNILCLTFSVSGATAMRERLRYLIGPDAYSVTINTIHGFCGDIIASHPQVFSEVSALEQISDVERYRELHKIIDGMLPGAVLFNRKDPYRQSREVLDAISLLKREGKTDSAELREIAAAYSQQMGTKSKEGTKAHEKNIRQAKKFEEFITVFERYTEMMLETKRYDYDDMILTVIKALEEEDWMRSELQERYQYILVDEFQDLSGSQNRVIELLTTLEGPDTAPNLFAVGDDDQAIYRFQGANIQHILRFTDRFREAKIVPLKITYRCSAPIISCASRLIERNEERLSGKIEGFTKELVANFTDEKREPVLLHAASDQLEPWLVADLVEDRIKDGVSPSEIAVLTQTNAELLQLYDVLVARGLPVDLGGKVDLLSHESVSQVVSILKSIADLGDSSALASALSCSCFSVHPADLGALFALRREEGSSLRDMLPKLENYLEQQTLELRDIDTLLAARDLVLDLYNKRDTRTVVATLEAILKDCGFLPEKGEVPDPQEFAALQAFFDRIKMRCYESPSFSFEVLLSDLQYYLTPEYSDVRLMCNFPHLTLDGVQLMTAHQSKGLEFHTVILYSVRDRHWNDRRRPSGLAMPRDLLFGWSSEQSKFEQSQDERRLMYVAMTRASKELILTCPKEVTVGDRTRDVSPSAYAAEAEIREMDGQLRDPEGSSLLLARSTPDMDEAYKSFLLRRIEHFSLSVTALNHFLEDPLLFLEKDLLQMPQTKTLALIYGNAVHSALRDWAIARGSAKVMTEQNFVEAFETYLKEREVLTSAERDNLIAHGGESLPRYFSQVLEESSPTIFKVEHSIKTHLDDIPIKGALDRIDLAAPDSRICTVIDYKTGAPKTESQIREGDYIRQLQYYRLLIEQSSLPLEPSSFVLDFVGEGTSHPVQRTFEISDTELRDLKKLIAEVWAKILALDFTPL